MTDSESSMADSGSSMGTVNLHIILIFISHTALFGNGWYRVHVPLFWREETLANLANRQAFAKIKSAKICSIALIREPGS